MTKPKFATKKFNENALLFVVYFLAVAITPILAKPMALLFKWVAYNFLQGLFEEIFTVLFWGVEAIALQLIAKKRKGKSSKEIGEDIAEEVLTPLLPMKNIWILTGICVVCVFLVSAVIGFQVKPFYDLGEKITGYDLWCKIGIIGRNLFKCMWIVAMLRAAKNMADEVVETLPNAKGYLTWMVTGGILLLFGIFDIFTSVASYPMGGTEWLLALVYFFFYAVFTAVHYFTQEHPVKSFFLIMFIYLF